MAFVPRGPFSPLAILVTAILVSFYITGSDGQRYRAVVFEFKPESPKQGVTLSRPQALDIMKKNIEIYKTQVRINKRNEIIVFPEYGLFGIFGYGTKYARRSDIYPFLEIIPDPDPRKAGWNPCERSGYGHEIQKELSCMAKNNDIYVVANVGEKVMCKNDRSCPKDGRYQYNTNVVYSSDGTLVAKYRKKHLFNEGYYDSPAKTEIVTFKTHFGKFGLMTSYDSLFKSPILDIVKEGIRDIVMPSAWTNSLPLFRAIQWHSSFAQGLQLNLMVSTVHDNDSKSYGSGIYGPDGAKAYTSDPNNYRENVIVERVKWLSYIKPRNKTVVIPRWPMSQTKTQNRFMAFLGQNVTFKFIELTKPSDDINICHGRFCCRLNYEVENRENIEKYALAVYKGSVSTLGQLLEVEVCAVVRCSPQCGQPIERANTYFDTFHLIGVNFSTPYIFPQVLVLRGHDAILPRTDKWEYKHGQILLDSLDNALHSASLIGRVYDKDSKDYRSPALPGRYDSRESFAPAQYVSSLILLVAFIASIMFSS